MTEEYYNLLGHLSLLFLLPFLHAVIDPRPVNLHKLSARQTEHERVEIVVDRHRKRRVHLDVVRLFARFNLRPNV